MSISRLEAERELELLDLGGGSSSGFFILFFGLSGRAGTGNTGISVVTLLILSLSLT